MTRGRSSSKKSLCQASPAARSNPVVCALGVQRGLIQPRGFVPLVASSTARQRPRSAFSSASLCVAGITCCDQPCAATQCPAPAIARIRSGYCSASTPLT